MPASAVRVEGLNAWRRELRKLEDSKAWTKELAAGNRGIAKELEPKAQARARSLGGQQRHFAGAIRGYGTAASARLGLSAAGKKQSNWGANAANWGVIDNISGRNRGTTPNLKVPWVGNTWDIATGQGPTAIVDTIVAETPYVIKTYGGVIDSVSRRAFPD